MNVRSYYESLQNNVQSFEWYDRWGIEPGVRAEWQQVQPTNMQPVVRSVSNVLKMPYGHHRCCSYYNPPDVVDVISTMDNSIVVSRHIECAKFDCRDDDLRNTSETSEQNTHTRGKEKERRNRHKKRREIRCEIRVDANSRWPLLMLPVFVCLCVFIVVFGVLLVLHLPSISPMPLQQSDVTRHVRLVHVVAQWRHSYLTPITRGYQER